MKGTDKYLVFIVGGALLLAGVAFVFALAQPKATYQPDDTPEGTVHNYLLALQEEDFKLAYSYLSPSLDGYPENRLEMREQMKIYSYPYGRDDSVTLSVDSQTLLDGSNAVVAVRETRFYRGDLFSSSQSSSTFEIRLALEGGAWKIVEADSYFSYCWTIEEGCR